MITLSLTEELTQRLQEEARRLSISPEEHIADILEGAVAPAANFEPGKLEQGLSELADLVRGIPCVTWLSTSKPADPIWWIKFQIDIESPVGWHVVQALGFVFNYLSVEERLPTVFKPVSPPPYLNGGPKDFLSWAIEAEIPCLDAGYIARVLKGRLPDPVDDQALWVSLDDADE